MEKRAALFLVLALGGGYAAWTHWDVIAEKLSVVDFSPGRLKAIELAKDSSDFERGSTNWQYLQSRHRRREIDLPAEPWSAEPIVGESYRVVARWTEDGDRVVVAFRVDVAKRTVDYEGALGDAPATPR
ncbi:MAG: hypothetical protein KF830_06065 [Planctomycetes bacterium]|nr:hypothetical protein [Planctomycetota bacterium]